MEPKDSKNLSLTVEKAKRLAFAIESVRNSRMAVEKLLCTISLYDEHPLGILGPILAELRDAEQEIGDLRPPSGAIWPMRLKMAEVI